MSNKLTEPDGEYNEGTDWEVRYRIGDIPWDHGRPVPAVQEALEFFGSQRRILVPGCGLGHDAAALALEGHSVEGWDLSATAVSRAQRLHPIRSLRFRERDLLKGEGSGEFDGIFEHTFLCAVGPDHWTTAVRCFAELLVPGGLLFAVLFTHLAEEGPPPWRIEETKARELFEPQFEILGVGQPCEAFARRKGEETVWRMKRR